MKFFLAILCYFLLIESNAQKEYFDIRVSLFCGQKKVIFDVDLISKKTSIGFNTNGKGFLEVRSNLFGEKYRLIMSHKDYVTKSIIIDATNVFLDEESTSQLIELEVEMIFKQDFVNYEIITKRPVGKIEIMQKSGVLQNNLDYGLSRKREIDIFLLNSEQKSKQNEEKFNNLIEQTKLYIDNNQFQTAETILNLAEEICVNTKSNLVRHLLNLAKNNKTEEINALFKIQKVADSLFVGKNYEKSISLYKRIVRLDPENSYSKARVLEINLLMVNLEKSSIEVPVQRISTAEIIFKAKNIQEKRIENNRNYYANRESP